LRDAKPKTDKKFSTQAKDLLIRFYGFRDTSFSLEPDYQNDANGFVWTYWTAPCYWYGESDEFPALYKLREAAWDAHTEWNEHGPVYVGPPIPRGNRALIKFVREKAGTA